MITAVKSLIVSEVIAASITVDSLPGCREPFNSFSHLIAAMFFTGLMVRLLRRGQGNPARVVALAVFGFTSVFLLLMSSIYHMHWPGSGRDVMGQMDVAAIFALIAGTFTPAYAILYRGPARVWWLLLCWGAALSGIIVRTLFFDSMSSWMGTGLFLLFGWIGAISAWDLWKRYSFAFIQPLVLGGLAYSCGAILLEFHWPTLMPRVLGPHELWHIAVLMGLGFHWRFVWQFADGNVNVDQESKPQVL